MQNLTSKFAQETTSYLDFLRPSGFWEGYCPTKTRTKSIFPRRNCYLALYCLMMIPWRRRKRVHDISTVCMKNSKPSDNTVSIKTWSRFFVKSNAISGVRKGEGGGEKQWGRLLIYSDLKSKYASATECTICRLLIFWGRSPNPSTLETASVTPGQHFS